MDVHNKNQVERQAELREISGSNDITYDVDWASFSKEALNYLDNAGFHRTSMAFRSLCNDAIGKDLVRTKIRVVKIRNASNAAASVQVQEPALILVGDYAKGISGVPSDRDIELAVLKALQIKKARVLDILLNRQIPARTAEVKEILGGGDCKLVVDLPTFDTAESIEFVDNVAFLRFVMALRNLSLNPTSRDMVRNSLKSAVFHNVHAEKDARFSFNNGVFDVSAVYDRIGTGHDSRIISDDEFALLFMKNLAISENLKKKELIEKIFPERTTELTEIFGKPIAYDVNWDSFSTNDEFNFLDNCSCHRINMAFRCLDNATKGKLQPTLKKIVIQNVTDASSKKLEVSGNTLTLQCAFGQGLNGCFSDNTILAALKKRSNDPVCI